LAARLQVPVLMGAGDVPEAAQGVNAEASPTTARAAFMSRFFPETFDTFTATPVTAPMSLAEYGVDAQVSPVGGHTEGSLIVTAGTTLFVGDLIRGGIVRRKAPRLHYYQLNIDAAHAALGAALGPEVTVVLPAHGGPLSPEGVRRFLADYSARQTPR
jgi:glyoxylase-like metal-dependent hydrolase (beta-lactamase superfamily II)